MHLCYGDHVFRRFFCDEKRYNDLYFILTEWTIPRKRDQMHVGHCAQQFRININESTFICAGILLDITIISPVCSLQFKIIL